MIIETLYLLASSAAIIAMAPQVKRLLVTRHSKGLSLASWMTWCVSQATAICYGVLLGAVPYIIINSIWFSYYITMVILIIKYRQPPREYVPKFEESLSE